MFPVSIDDLGLIGRILDESDLEHWDEEDRAEADALYLKIREYLREGGREP